MATVKVNLTQGFESEVFKPSGESQLINEQRIEFDDSRKIKRVQGDDDTIGCIFSVKFMDKDGNQVKFYDQKDNNLNALGMVHEIGENEELIGVYGTMVSFCMR